MRLSPRSYLLRVDGGVRACSSHFMPWRSPPSILVVSSGVLRTAKAPGLAGSFSSPILPTGS